MLWLRTEAKTIYRKTSDLLNRCSCLLKADCMHQNRALAESKQFIDNDPIIQSKGKAVAILPGHAESCLPH